MWREYISITAYIVGGQLSKYHDSVMYKVHVRLCTATGKLTCILNINHRKPPINVQLMSFYQIHQRKSAISNLLTKISTYLSSPEVFHNPARVVTNTVWKMQDSKWRKISLCSRYETRDLGRKSRTDLRS